MKVLDEIYPSLSSDSKDNSNKEQQQQQRQKRQQQQQQVDNTLCNLLLKANTTYHKTVKEVLDLSGDGSVSLDWNRENIIKMFCVGIDKLWMEVLVKSVGEGPNGIGLLLVNFGYPFDGGWAELLKVARVQAALGATSPAVEPHLSP